MATQADINKWATLHASRPPVVSVDRSNWPAQHIATETPAGCFTASIELEKYSATIEVCPGVIQ